MWCVVMMWCDVWLCDVWLCNVWLCDVMCGYVMCGYVTIEWLYSYLFFFILFFKIGKQVKFSTGDFILREADQHDYFYKIQQGEVRMEKKASNGVEYVLRSLGKGSIVGETSLIWNQGIGKQGN